MPRKLAGYLLLSLLSFFFFTVIFNVIAIAQVSAQKSPSEITQSEIVPTPTIYNAPQNSSDKQPPLVSSPTPTITPVQQANSTSVSKETQTTSPTETPVPPTATPTPTDIPTATPTPSPTAAPITTSSTDPQSLYGKYGSQYSVSADELRKIASCESGERADAQSPNGDYVGMYQFAASSWSSTRSAMGLDPNPDLRANAEEAIKTAAFMLSRGQENAWPNCH